MNQKFFKSIVFVIAVLSLPNLAQAEIRINEVAWMGTSSSQYEEWIELYNDGTAQSLDGWKIYKAGGSTTLISLSGNISAGQYLLVCRTTPSVTSPLGGICNIQGAFGGSGLNNTSENILLKDGSGNTVDSIDATSGWPAGDSTNKNTMQKSGSGWITASATPGATNSSVDNGGGVGNEDEEEEEETEEQTGEGSSKSTTVYPTQLLKIESPKIAIAGSPAHFKAEALDFDRSGIFKGRYVWNMGDGNTREMSAKFEYTRAGFYYNYEYPGTYSVSVKYYHSFFEDKVPPDLETQFTIEVLSPTVSISKIYPDGSVEIKNTSGNSIDLSLWQLRDGSGKNFIIPEDTHLQSNKTIVFSNRITKLNFSTGVSLFTPTNSLASSGGGNTVARKINPGSTSVVSKTPSTESASSGEVLGVEDADVVLVEEVKESDTNQGLVWILLFIILILVTIIVVFLIRKEERTDTGYELVDE